MQPAAQTLQTRSQVGHRPPDQARRPRHLVPERLPLVETDGEPPGDGRIEAHRYWRDAVEPRSITASKSEHWIWNGGVPALHS
jgi:hypothetical protein